ncbi:MAG: tRNA dihydrouridine(20/20a) synthase DusA [Haemophilus parainfluenzae]|nr:tRNA dihydrouridine(20/20a) synthase DusA [Haemophilus parainfluenzae]
MSENQPHFYRGRFSVAPMLDWTTRHCRYFHRQFSKNALLYTEMVTAPAIIHAKYDHLDFDLQENPVALQLGGSDPAQLEINLNVGCPSDRVQNGMFGACLMAKADLVAECIAEMQRVVNIPVTVKTRIGIDGLDSYEFLCDFIEKVHYAGCQEFIVHARKAWLSGLSPKENREIPPLDYDRVYQLKKDFPQLTIAINGGIKTIEEIKHHLQFVDGVMVGREAYQNPSLLGYVDQMLFDANADIVTPRQAVKAMLGAFQNCKGARQWRRYLSENAFKQGAGIEVVETALSFVETN